MATATLETKKIEEPKEVTEDILKYLTHHTFEFTEKHKHHVNKHVVFAVDLKTCREMSYKYCQERGWVFVNVRPYCLDLTEPSKEEIAE